MAALFVGAAMFHTAAHAQMAIQGDLILGFQTPTPNTGNSTDLEVDLGAATLFTALAGTGQSIDLSSDFTLNDLTGTYGTNPTALSFGVTGTQGVPTNEVYISEAGSTVPTRKTSQSIIRNQISPIYGEFGNGNAGTGTSDSLVTASDTGSYGNIADNYGTGSQGTYGNTFQNTEAFFSNAGTETLKLYDVKQGTGPAAEFGTLVLTVSGTTESLIFTGTAAAPEPSTYALMGAGLLVLVTLVHRKAFNS
jgi:hypothetical protein